MNGGTTRISDGQTEPDRRIVVPALGVTQILAWGSSFYLLTVLAGPIAAETGWSLAWVVGGLSLGLLTAGLVSPRAGGLIERHGGRNVLAASAALLAAGHVALASSTSLSFYLLAWVLVGLGMGAGLYDAAFATLGRIYGLGARSAITTLTLFGGFASTVCWPLSAFLVASLGWRGTCLAYAGLHLALALPLHLLTLPAGPPQPAAHPPPGPQLSAIGRRRRPLIALLAGSITVSTMIAGIVSVHLIAMLEARGLPLAAAVGLAALVGPSQVGARAIEMAIARFHHPLWTLLCSACLVASGIAVLWSGLPWIVAGLVLYGAGIGIESIARGTVPLALFGAEGYAALMGRLALPSRATQALSLWSAAYLVDWLGTRGLLDMLLAAVTINLALVAALLLLSAPARR